MYILRQLLINFCADEVFFYNISDISYVRGYFWVESLPGFTREV